MQEMLSLANEMAQRVAYDYRDWTALRTTQTFIGNGTTTVWPLPANYKRLLLTSNVWRSTSQLMPMTFIADTDEWLNHRVRGFTGSFGEWTLFGNDMHIYPVMLVGQNAYFGYLDKNCIALNGGGFGFEFQNDLDTFLLGDRLLKLAMIWQWKANKGGSYAEDMGTFGDALAIAMGHDSPAPIIVGRLPITSTARTAYPGPTP